MNRTLALHVVFIAALASLNLLTGCFFTGVESTPRITTRDVKREVGLPTAEDTYLSAVADEPLSAWRPGKEFMVTDPRVERIFGATASTMRDTDPTGTVITWSGAEEIPSLTGSTVTDLNFHSPGGELLTYRVNRPLRRLLADSITEIPFTIQLSTVERAAEMMEGKDFWVITSLWRDDNDTPLRGRKFVKVHIDSVSPGNSLFPLKIAFTDVSGQSARLFIHPGAKGSAARTFSHVFSFTDPRLRHPNITPEVWQLIVDGRVAEGMTTEECRLAIGAPKEVDRGATNSFLREAWMYDNGRWLLFEDGRLKRFH